MRAPAFVVVIGLAVGCGSAAPRLEAVTAVAAHAPLDPAAAADRFAPDAELALIAGPSVRGRDAIRAALTALAAEYRDARLTLGRQWLHDRTHVVELLVTARRGPRAIGLAGAAVAVLDDAGQIARARVYLDLPTLVAQLDPARLPDGLKTRPLATALIAGAATTRSTGSATEAANLATTAASWARLDAHDPAGVLVPMAPGYVYDDLSGPAPLDRAGTLALLERFLPLVPDFRIAEKPTFFAAGRYVVTESVETMTVDGAPTTLHGLDIKELDDRGHVVREWQYANGAEALAALAGIELALP